MQTNQNNATTLKILVIDDNENNRKAAQTQLADHDLTVVGTYDEGQKLLGVEPRGIFREETRHDFDVVLCDLLLPASDQNQADRSLVGREMPVGIFLALLAARGGAKYVAVFTDTDHHAHPASACFDAVSGDECEPSPFRVEDAKVILSNTRKWVRNFAPDDLTTPLGWVDDCPGQIRAKHWRSLFNYLLGD